MERRVYFLRNFGNWEVVKARWCNTHDPAKGTELWTPLRISTRSPHIFINNVCNPRRPRVHFVELDGYAYGPTYGVPRRLI